MSIEPTEITCTARVVRVPSDREALTLRTEDGLFPVRLVLATVPFEPGDVVEIRLLRREGDSLPRLCLPPQFGHEYGTPIPISDAAEARVSQARRHAVPLEIEETEAEPVA